MSDKFDPGFDMPETAEQAVAVLDIWSDPANLVFSSRRAKRCADLLRAVLAQEAGKCEPVALSVPDECPHLIVFDDTDRENLLFAGAGSRSAALKTWEKISQSWNAHLFVRVERNSRDDRYPSAHTSPPAPVSVVLPDRLSWSGIASWKQRAEITAWNACLDKVKELNQ